MNYQRIYDKLISSRQQFERRKGQNYYYEWHHIVPRCLSGSSDKSNLVLLTAREHFIAHRLLTKIYPKSQKLLFAVGAFHRKHKQRKLTSAEIKSARKAHAKAQSLRSRALVAKGAHRFQAKLFRENSSKQQKTLATKGRHNFQTKEASEASSKRVTWRNKALAAEGKHQFQTKEAREA